MTIRCAIYTRKSSEEGLEQSFNSLDAQRACGESYVMSQTHEGWETIPKHYDDGGYSGGSTNRPALQELLSDIEAGLVDCVIVYKNDRLARSVLDFLKMMEFFEKHKVNYVSVTDYFNTSNSVGRLASTILLSIGQYEREVTGDRIRDKIAASKKLGYWLGGTVPLGYNSQDRGLVINEDEATTVHYIFEKFSELKSITQLLQDLKTNNITTKSGKQFSKKTLRQLLENPIYKGFVSHKGTHYNGLHEGIISEKQFEKIQSIFQKMPEEKTHNPSNVLLKDIIRCGICDCAMTPTHCNKKGRKYRYYACSNHLRMKNCISANKTLPAGEVEEFVSKSVRKLLKNPAITTLAIQKLTEDGVDINDANDSLKNIDSIWETLHFNEQQKITKLLIKNVIVENSGFRIALNPEGANQLLREIA